MDGDGENFSEWLERLELVANTCRWDNQARLVNVATRLRGSASRFYCSCTPQQCSNYYALTEALCKRFTPVQIQPVQSSRFHERKQGPNESVDDYQTQNHHSVQYMYTHLSGYCPYQGQSGVFAVRLQPCFPLRQCHQEGRPSDAAPGLPARATSLQSSSAHPPPPQSAVTAAHLLQRAALLLWSAEAILALCQLVSLPQ